MQRVSLICLGRLKEKYLVDACAEYIKRLRPYCRLEIIELPPVALPEDPSQAQINEALQAEAQKNHRQDP